MRSNIPTEEALEKMVTRTLDGIYYRKSKGDSRYKDLEGTEYTNEMKASAIKKLDELWPDCDWTNVTRITEMCMKAALHGIENPVQKSKVEKKANQAERKRKRRKNVLEEKVETGTLDVETAKVNENISIE